MTAAVANELNNKTTASFILPCSYHIIFCPLYFLDIFWIFFLNTHSFLMLTLKKQFENDEYVNSNFPMHRHMHMLIY